MNANQLINMVIRRVTRRLINKGVNTGIDMAARRGKPNAEMTTEERDQAKRAKDVTNRARQAGRIKRRLFR